MQRRQCVSSPSSGAARYGITRRMTWAITRITPDNADQMDAVNALFADAFEDPDTYGTKRPDQH